MKTISGNTFPVKEQLKKLGGKYDPMSKSWMVPDENELEALKLVEASPARQFSPATYRPQKCRDCGTTASRYNPIYQNGQCKHCWLGDKEERDMGY